MTELEKQAEGYANSISNTNLEKLIAEKAYIKGFKDANQWVSVSEQLPKENIRCLVLVHRKNEMIPTIEIAKKFEAVNLLMRNREMDDNFIIQGSVTHWQPLPSTDRINLK